MDVQYIGEHLWPGRLGHFFVITSFVASLFSTFCYFTAVRTENDLPNSNKWRLLGRGGFILHTVSLISIFVALFYIIANHLFEYHYAWEHSSYSLPGEYLLSCFWEGQQGSFMLWIFWHCVLGLVVMGTAKSLETRTMTIISLVQVALGTMILGFYLGDDIKIGSTPFTLLRDAMQGAPIFQQANYMEFVKDGNGLNVLLQNYWMVIHPPVLFLGFASTLIPFAYCIAAMWKGDYQTFVKPTLAWSLLNGAVLGTGIMMGGAWAYESLNFGGYWAWDPVENASLVPWITMIAALHTLLIYRSTGRALTMTMILFAVTHLLIWYSTFLTRTGILGKTSVHAFTGDGAALTYHLLIVIGVLLIISLVALIARWRSLPRIKSEEETLSREFWMFIGSVILFLSSIQIIITTSIPVWSPLAKWITGKDFAPPSDVMQHYNNIQVWVAIIIGILSATVLYMKFKNTDGKALGKKLGLTALIALLMAAGIAWGQHITAWQYVLMLFAACYGIVANIYYGIVVQKAKFKKLGPSVAHLGFATVLLGILLSSYNKHPISFSTAGIPMDFGKKTQEENAKENSENVTLFRGIPVAMGDYFATYIGDSDVAGKDRRIYYKVQYERKDTVTNKVIERFMLYPDAFINPKGQQGLSANPSTKHYWNRDLFTFINAATDRSKTDTSTYRSHIVGKPGDTIWLNNGYMVFNGTNKNDLKNKRYVPAAGDEHLEFSLKVYDLNNEVKEINPVYIIKDRSYVSYVEDTLHELGLFARANLLIKHNDAGKDTVLTEILVRQTDPKDDFIVLKALVFPYINVLWLGIIVMVFGFFISLGDVLSRKVSARSADK
ncbi:MAG: cytochrome c assembly protein [Flavipsychrobacter sp.]|jgi:cytochrome c-type biogenesis protein CcmF|nr:cytochrome c assembly protein [Flavipsychrobacter sp.]